MKQKRELYLYSSKRIGSQDWLFGAKFTGKHIPHDLQVTFTAVPVRFAEVIDAKEKALLLQDLNEYKDILIDPND